MKSTEAEAQIVKRNDPQYVFSHINRDINLINDGDKMTKKKTAEDLYNFIVVAQPSLKPELIQELLISVNGKLIKYAFFDSIDKVREATLKILIYMYSYCTNVIKFFPFIFSTLVDKLDCDDLEGVGNLPEDFRPTPSQNPQRVIKTTENIEEIRVLYVKLLEALISNENCEKNDFRLFVQDIVNITRTLCMDPCVSVSIAACEFTKLLAEKFGKDLLYYFNSILSRGLFYALSHKQAKLRLAALNAIDKLLYCSPYKKNVEIMEQLTGFRDPNVVPIKDFYEPSTKFNYLAYLSADPNVVVLKRFYEVITSWLLNTEDRNEHEPRLITYILTGLFNKNDDIALYVYERFNSIGELYEKDFEKDLREQKQYGVDAPWIQYCEDVNKLIYPFPLSKRPSLGCRKVINKYLRRYIKNLCKEFEGIDENIKLKVANLLLYSIVYSEDGIVEYLDQVFLLFEKDFIKVSNNLIDVMILKGRKYQDEIFDVLVKANKLIGRFCDYESLTKVLYQTIKGDLNGDYQDIQRGALITLKHIFMGHISSSKDGLGIFKGKLKEFFGVIGEEEKVLEFLDTRASFDLIIFYKDIFEEFAKNVNKYDKEGLDEINACLEGIFMNIVHALGANEFLTTHEVFTFIEKNLSSINESVKTFTKGETKNYFSLRTISTLTKIYDYLENNYVSMQNKYYKILYLFMKSKLFFSEIHDEKLIKILISIYNRIFQNDENYNVHSLSLSIILNFLQEVKISYKGSEDKKAFIYNNDLFLSCIDEFTELLFSVLQPYTKIDGEQFKFKFVDLLKDEKELEKKKQKSPKTLKTELRKTVLLFIKTMFNKSDIFALNNLDKEEIKSKKLIAYNYMLKIFNDEKHLKYFYEEAESVRVLFSSIYYQFLVKLFVVRNKDVKLLQEILPKFEPYFAEEVYDQNVDIRQMCFTLLNLFLGVIPKSSFYEPLKQVFSYKEEQAKYNYEAMKALSYVQDESKELEKYFSNFKLVMTVIVNAYLNEKMGFSTLCETSMKLIIEKFPLYVFNELMKSQKKGQIARMEFLNNMLVKNLK